MNLNDKIWLTRKSRIEASTRMERNALYSQILIGYYATFNIIYAIIDIKYTTIDYTYQLLIASVVTFGISMFVPSMRFTERATTFKQCYIRLGKLLEQLKTLEGIEGKETSEYKDALDKIQRKYAKLLDSHENHSSCDYYSVKFKIKDDTEGFSLSSPERALFIAYKVIRWLFFIVLFGLPFVLLIWL